MELRNSGKIKLFKFGSEASEFCVLFTEDYKSHVRKFIQNMSLNQAVIGKYTTKFCIIFALLILCNHAFEFLV